MRWTIRVKVRDALYDLPISAQWQESDKDSPEAVAESVLKAIKEKNPPLIVIVKIQK